MRYRYHVLLVLALVLPVGLRLATWETFSPESPDPQMVQAGESLFEHEWRPDDPLSPDGDGLGPVFNAKSCVACHRQGGVGGGGPRKNNVLTFFIAGNPHRQGVVHSSATERKFRETLKEADARLPVELPLPASQIETETSSMPNCVATTFRFPVGVFVSERNTPALFGAGLIDAIPERAIVAAARRQKLASGFAKTDSEKIPVGRVSRLPDGRVGRFGWKGQTASLGDFVRAACANELGLGNPAKSQPAPLGSPKYKPPGLDLTDEQCDQMTAFVASLPRPVEKLPGLISKEQANTGRKLFHQVGCAMCHTPSLGGVDGLYSDLLLHRMGRELQGGGSYDPPPEPEPSFDPSDGPEPSEWRTPPLWGVADSAPYLHDGRAATLQQAIELHGGQGGPSARRFRALGGAEQSRLIAFLKTLRAPGQTSEKRR